MINFLKYYSGIYLAIGGATLFWANYRRRNNPTPEDYLINLLENEQLIVEEYPVVNASETRSITSYISYTLKESVGIITMWPIILSVKLLV